MGTEGGIRVVVVMEGAVRRLQRSPIIGCAERQQYIWRNKVKESGTHCSSPRLSCLHNHSGCHTSSGLGCSCYSRSGIHEVRRSFHLFHQEQTNTKMKMASKSMNINTELAIIFSTCNHRFLRVSLSKSDTEFKTQYVLKRLTCRKMKYLTVLPIIPQQNLWQEVGKSELGSWKHPQKFENTAAVMEKMTLKEDWIVKVGTSAHHLCF